jgi:NAD+ kinase
VSDGPVAVTTVGAAADGPVSEALANAAAAVEALAPDDVASGGLGASQVVVAVGEPGLLAVAAEPPGCPVVPVGTGFGRYDVPAAALGAVVDATADDTVETVAHPRLDVSVAGERAGTAVADVTLLTADPARISEFAVSGGDGWTETVRADGVVVATPLGSTGYARAAGGPVLAPDTGLATVPVSAYAMHVRPWVLTPPVSMSVERDEAPVTLRLDDAVSRPVPPGAPVEITVGGSVSLVTPQQFPEA